MTDQKPITKAQRKRARKAQSTATAADIWEDRDGKARPTPERRAKGAFVLRDGDDAGVTVAVDEAATFIDALAARGIISAEQRDGGHDFAALMERTALVRSGRSCLDFSPVGYDGDVPPTHGELRDAQERAELYLAVGTFTWAVMRRACHEWATPEHAAQSRKLLRMIDVQRLRDGLDMCVKFWR